MSHICFLLGAFSSYNLNIVIDPVSFTRWCTAICLYCVVEDVTTVYEMLDKLLTFVLAKSSKLLSAKVIDQNHSGYHACR